MKTRPPKYPHFLGCAGEYWTTPAGSIVLRTARYGRGGTKSPVLVLVYWGGRWRTIIERKRLGLTQTIQNLLRTVYRYRSLRVLIFKDNPLLSRLPKKEDFTGDTFAIPFTGGLK